MSKAPWYKRFAGDFVSDPYVQAMTAEQYGWFSAALDMMWIHTPQGYLPSDMQMLCKMIGRCDEMHFQKEAQIVIDRFKVTEDGRWIYHPKMIEQVEHISEVSEKRRDAANTRHQNPARSAKHKQSTCNANAQQKQTDLDSDTDKEKGATNLSLREQAHAICQLARMPATNPNLDVVIAAIEIKPANELVAAVEKAISEGKTLNRFWFENGGFNAKAPEPAKPKPLSPAQRVRLAMEEERQERVARVQ